MSDSEKNKKTSTIGFRGTEDYRNMLQQAALDRKIKVQRMLEDAVSVYLGASTDKPIPGSQVIAHPDSEHAPTSAGIGDVPASVLKILHPHLRDPDFLECLIAVATLWSIGDQGAKDAILHNCRTFVRGAEAIQRLAVAGKEAPGGKQDHKEPHVTLRVKGLLDSAESVGQVETPGEGKAPPPRPGGSGTQSVGSRPVSKTPGRRK